MANHTVRENVVDLGLALLLKRELAVSWLGIPVWPLIKLRNLNLNALQMT